MFDAVLRRRLEAPLLRLSGMLDVPVMTPDRLTLLGLATGLASAASASQGWWGPALVLWVLSRGLDGLDGPLARRRGRASEAGGFLDVTADFLVYGAGVVGVAVGTGSTYPFLAVLLAYYVNGTAFLAFSSAAERTGQQLDDGRTFSFVGGLAEGAETIVVHALWLLVPAWAPAVAVVWAAVVGASAVQRMVTGTRILRQGRAEDRC